MLMGFNTDVKQDGIQYHVQTEPRKDAGIETTVYTRGAVIHKLTTSYRSFLESSDYSEEKVKQMLEDQHREVITQIRSGVIRPPTQLSIPT